jgi:hypothetical protein
LALTICISLPAMAISRVWRDSPPKGTTSTNSVISATCPLHYAVKKEHLDVAQFLPEHGVSVDARHQPAIGNTRLSDVADRWTAKPHSRE